MPALFNLHKAVDFLIFTTVLETLPRSKGSLRYFPRLYTILIGEIFVKLALLLVIVGEHKALDFSKLSLN